MERAIIDYLYAEQQPRSNDQIALAVGQPLRKVVPVLVQMDDDGKLLMRNGWYRLSAATLVIERGRRLGL